MQTRCYDGKNGNTSLNMRVRDIERKVLERNVRLILFGLDKLNELKQGIEYEPNLTLYDYFKTWCETFKNRR